MKSKDVGLLDRLPARTEIGREITQLDHRRRWLRSLYRLRCRIDEQSDTSEIATDAPQTAEDQCQGGVDE